MSTRDNYKYVNIQNKDIYESLGNQIIGAMPDIVENKLFGIDYRRDLLDKINSSPYIKLSTGVELNESNKLILIFFHH